jgi:Ca-activated chloride channel family protein
LRVTFVVYGHNKALACQAVQVVRKLDVLDDGGKQTLTRLIAQMQAVGATPIALALRTAGQELAGTRSPSGLILISDGMETCQGDPAAEAATLAHNLNLTFGVNVIGFDVRPDERQTLARIAAAGRGKYYNAHTSAELAQTLQAMGQQIQRAIKPAPLANKVSRGERIARAVKVLPPTVELPPMAQVSVGAAGANLGAVNYGTLAKGTKYGEELRIPVDEKAGSFDVWWFPKEGKGIRLAEDIVIDKERPLAEVRPEARLGLVRVDGKDLPKPEAILLVRAGLSPLIVTKANSVQWAKAYSTDMPVPEGTYDLWLVPAKGAAELLAENVEVHAGKLTQVE